MKRRLFVMLLCCVLMLFCSCSTENKKYKRISFASEAMGEQMNSMSESTMIVSSTKEAFSTQMPIYRISERNISSRECDQMKENLEIPSKVYDYQLEGNYLNINLASRTNFDRGFFEMTDEEAEELAWELFSKIPFIEGEFECIGIRDTYTVRNSEGSHIARAGVVFCRLLDGVRVTGEESCTLYFDGSGLVEIRIRLYEYKKSGTMEMVPLSDAETKLKTPDDFDMLGKVENKQIDILQVQQVKVRLVNQYSRGCMILQPIYYFEGVATLDDNTQTEFSSKIIAIPEEMTYEEE